MISPPAIQISENEWFFPDDMIVYNSENSTISILESVPVDTVEEESEN